MKFKNLNSKLLIITLLLGGFFRFYNLNWDQGHFFHPDERNIAMAVSRIHLFDQLNPHFFAYGSFPIYLYRLIGETFTALTGNLSWVSDWADINLIGRSVSALLSTLTILLIFLLVKKLWNEKVGLLAAALTAFSPSFIQTAHFAVTESMLVFWLILIALLSFNLKEKPTLKNYLKLGIIAGLAVATKVIALSFLVIPATIFLFYFLKDKKEYLKFFNFFLVAFAVFALFSPYVFLGHQKFLESMNYESGVATGSLKVVYTLQFNKTLPYFFQIKNFFWQIGPLALLGLLGTVFFVLTAFRKRDKKMLILLAFPTIYFLYVGSWHTKFIRYMVPFLPFLVIFASWFLIEIQKRFKLAGTVLIGLTTIVTLLWTLAFFTIYTKPSTRIVASEWIYQNISPGAKILTEHWDDGLPVDLSFNNPAEYQTEALTLYEPDNQQKINYYAVKLSTADYVVINSRRLYGTLINLPEKYPLTSRYYQLLFSGQLGYDKVAEFSSYPEVFGLEINDDLSEETFQVYDHPKVLVFKNNQHLSSNELRKVLNF